MTSSDQLSPVWKLVIAIVLCQVTGLLSGWITAPAIDSWFDTLNKPSWNPPAWLFGPVWTFLYLLMGISLWLVWKSEAPEPEKKKAAWTFALQLFLNFWWSIIFFKFRSPDLAFMEVLLLLAMILLTIFRFAAISRLAAWLLVPYVSWVTFAAILNYTIWQMN